MLRCASYALEMFSHGGLRSHVISALVTDDTIQLIYYDRSLIIMSQPLSFLEDPPHFIAMLRAIGDLSLSQWGYVRTLIPAPISVNARRQKDIFDGLELKLNNGKVLKLGGTVYHQHALIGRGTCVVRAECVNEGRQKRNDDEAWDGPLIVKLSWPAKSRTPEQDIIKKAREAADNGQHRWVLNHLPKVLHDEDIDVNLLSQALIDNIGGRYEERVLRAIVQEELYPITERTTAPELAESFRDIFNCYRWLYEYPKVLHRDISVHNLMLRKKSGKVYGVLNDFDLSVTTNINNTSSKQRTGTQPFMAIDLLQPDPPVHKYRHDLESMFYVLVWITSRFDSGEEIIDPPLQEWADYGGATLVEKKSSSIISEPPPPMPKFEPLERWVVSMHVMVFQRGLSIVLSL